MAYFYLLYCYLIIPLIYLYFTDEVINRCVEKSPVVHMVVDRLRL